MGCLKKRGEEPDRCSPVGIADEVGVPMAVVFEVIGGCLALNEKRRVHKIRMKLRINRREAYETYRIL